MSEKFKTLSAAMLLFSRTSDKGEENIIESRKQAIENYKNHIPYSEFGWGDKHEII